MGAGPGQARRAGRARPRPAGHQQRGRDLVADPGRQRVRQLGRVRRRLPRQLRVVRASSPCATTPAIPTTPRSATATGGPATGSWPSSRTRRRSGARRRGARWRPWARARSRPRSARWCSIPRSARSIVGTVFSVANGSAFWRKSSYLIGREGTAIASALVTIEDDPLIPRAPGRGRSTATACRLARTSWSRAACSDRSCATSTARASWAGRRPARPDAASAATRGRPRRT